MIPNESSNVLIDEDELETSQQIALYTELIRILEKDIDDAQSRSSKEGWTTWTILGAIAGAIFVLLGQTKDLQAIPPETTPITITFIILFQFILGAYNFLTGNKYLAKEKRLIDSKLAFKGRRFLFYVRFIILVFVSIFIYSIDYPVWIKFTSIILIFIPVIYVLLTLFLTSYTQRPIGNNPKYQKVSPIFGFLFLFFYLVAIILLGYQLNFPVGQSLSAAYVIGLSLSAIVVLAEVLLSTSISTEEVSDLQELKDDIVFIRVGLNEALNRYKILREGKSLFDEMKGDFDRIMGCLYREEEIYNEQKKILKKISELTPLRTDSEQIQKDKNEQISLLSNSFGTYTREMNGLVSLVTKDLPPFNQKLRKSAEACGDYEAENLINNLIVQKLNELVQKENEMDSDKNNLMQQMNKLNSENGIEDNKIQ